LKVPKFNVGNLVALKVVENDSVLESPGKVPEFTLDDIGNFCVT